MAKTHPFRIFEAFLGVVVLVIIGLWWLARPTPPDAFYQPDAAIPSQPGTLIRQEIFERGVADDAIAWRILYSTTRADGSPAVASAIVMTSRVNHTQPRPTLAWTHGTTGVVPACAPSVLEDPFANVPAIAQLIDEGWIYVATDYVGLGTAGPHPYLIGEGQARSALDAVRAARQMQSIQTDGRTLVWGHSQGGHAALWTAALAPQYAPDVPLLGVAAIAPATDLGPMLDAIQHGPAGRILSAYALRAYSEAYSNVVFEAYVPFVRGKIARDMTGRCLQGRKALFSVAESLALGGTIFATPPSDGGFGERLAQNVPTWPIEVPVLIAQGLADEIVQPSIQARYVNRRCAAGQALDFRVYEGEDHLSIVAPYSRLMPDLLRWTRDRLAEVPVPAGCN